VDALIAGGDGVRFDAGQGTTMNFLRLKGWLVTCVIAGNWLDDRPLEIMRVEEPERRRTWRSRWAEAPELWTCGSRAQRHAN
jgi:hypothetical protein